ncbi:MAG: sugar ABC transporter substrate-binding protein [Chloroflexota bacterium]|nr:sugar ABC transporter substrate-binding protein [Chloroflexota bacterium]
MSTSMKRWFSIMGVLTLALSLLPVTGGAYAQGSAQAGSRTFAETGHSVTGKFLDYWNNHGGLAQQGFPLTEAQNEVSSVNGKTYMTQYFERSVFEAHPENQPPYDILLSLLGSTRYQQKYGSQGAPNQKVSTVNAVKFPQTNHSVGGKFRTYWESHGGLAQQGYPVSDEFTEVSDLNGKPYTVQYFERAVFEMHPENAAPNDVLLSQLGKYAFNQKSDVVVKVPAATIRVGSYESGAALDVWNGLIKKFNALYPQITISFEPVPDNYGTKLLTQIAANDAPDVFQVGDGDVRMFVERGGAADITSYVQGKGNLPGVDPSVYYSTLFQTGVVDGKTAFFTKDYSPLGIYYNKDLFDKAHVAYPKDGWTWEDFQATAIKLTSGSGPDVQYGADLRGNWTRAAQTWVYQNGGEMTSPDGTKSSGYLDSPATVEAIQYYTDLYNKYKVAPSPADVGTTFKGVDLFQTGKAAMSMTGIWPEAGYAKDPNFHFGVVGLPQHKKRANQVCWSGLGLFKGSKNPDQAWLFLRYVGGQAGQTAFAANGLPSIPSVAGNLKIAQDPNKSVFLSENKYLAPLPDMRSRYWNDTTAKFFGEALDNLLANGGDVKAALTDAAQKADAEYAKLSKQP